MPWSFDSQTQTWTLDNSGGGGREVVVFNELVRGDYELSVTCGSYLHEIRACVRLSADGKDCWECGFVSIGSGQDSNLSSTAPRERRYAFVLRPVRAGQTFTGDNAGYEYDPFWGFPLAYFPFNNTPRTITPTGNNTQNDYDSNTVIRMIEDCGLLVTDTDRPVTIRVRCTGTKIEVFLSTQVNQEKALLSVQSTLFYSNPTRLGFSSSADTATFPTHHTDMATTTGPLDQTPVSDSRFDYPVTADDKWRDGVGADLATAGFGAGDTNSAVPVALGAAVPALTVSTAHVDTITERVVPYQRQLCVVAGGQLYVSADGANPNPIGGLDMTRDQPVSVAVYQQAAYFVDGSAVRIYDPLAATAASVQKFDPTNGLDYTVESNVVAPFPGQVKNTALNVYEPGTTTAFIITAHIDRLFVVTKDDPQNLVACASGDPKDWDYASTIQGRAFRTSTDVASSIGEPITMLAPARDDRMVIGCTGKIYVFSGDPAINDNRIDVSSSDRGVTGFAAFTFSNENACFVMTNQGPGVVVDTQFKSLCEGKLTQYAFPGTHVGAVYNTMIRDGRRGGIFIGNTRVNASGNSLSNQRGYYQEVPTDRSVHLWFNEANGAFFPIEFPPEADPTCVIKVDDRIFFGCRDGRIREMVDTFYSDDIGGTKYSIDAYMPLRLVTPLPDVDRSQKIVAVTVVMSTVSSDTFMVYHSGETIEECYSYDFDEIQSDTYVMTLTSGRNRKKNRIRGNAITATIYNTTIDQTFFVEAVQVFFTKDGKERGSA